MRRGMISFVPDIPHIRNKSIQSDNLSVAAGLLSDRVIRVRKKPK